MQKVALSDFLFWVDKCLQRLYYSKRISVIFISTDGGKMRTIKNGPNQKLKNKSSLVMVASVFGVYILGGCLIVEIFFVLLFMVAGVVCYCTPSVDYKS